MKFIKYSLLMIVGLLIATSCKEEIDVNNDQDYSKATETYGFVKSVNGARGTTSLTLFGTGTVSGLVYFELSKAATSDVNVKFEVSQEVLDTYNSTHGTNYTMYPADKISFTDGGVATVATGGKETKRITMTATSTGAIGTQYAVPITVTTTDTGVKSSGIDSYIYLVNQVVAKPNADKGTGIITVGYVEVNDENILNLGEYTMEGSGKPFFDVVHIFAANVNVNANTKRVYLNCNDKVQFVLNNAEKLIRPLQAKGIKVCLSILGNHDESGLASLSNESAADFAKELKDFVDLYGLDGIDFDDEWSNYNYGAPNPGFVTPSSAAYARLVYETRKAMPDKYISVYEVGNDLPSGDIEGVSVTSLYNNSYNPYYGSWWDSSHMGTDKSKFGPYPSELSSGINTNIQRVKQIREDGYGVIVFYNFKQMYAPNYLDKFAQSAKILYDDELIWTGNTWGRTEFTPTNVIKKYEDYLGTYTLTPNQGLFWYTGDGGPYWQWKDNVAFTLRIEKNEDNKSFKVYGWGDVGEEIPFIMDFDYRTSLVSINLPQVVKDSEGVEWTYVGRSNYNLAKSSYTTNSLTPAFTGLIDSAGKFTITGTGTYSKTMSPIQYIDGGGITNIKGGIYQDVAYAPYTLTKH